MRDGIAESRHLICVRSTRRTANRVSIGLQMPPPMLWKTPLLRVGFFWRRRRDSNPRGLAPKRFSRPPRYDRFDTPPYAEIIAARGENVNRAAVSGAGRHEFRALLRMV